MQTETTCTFPVADLKKGKVENGRLGDAIFYELYLEDTEGKLANVPVLIKNYRTADGKLPNADGSDKANWIFSRRFVVYDTVSGVPAGGLSGDAIPDVVRWASSITLKVTMDQEATKESEKLLRPYLIVDYRERDVTTISSSE